MSLSPGTRLGPYEIAAQIGVGGMGEVYRATDTKLKRQVAIKVLPASVAGDPDRLARFQREAEVLASLNHPNIAAIDGMEDAHDASALVMELVEGPTLAELLDARRAGPSGPAAAGSTGPGLRLDEALPIAKQIAEALEAAHEQGIIHRDLKPANIKVRPDGTVKVLDFGLAKAMEPTGAASTNASMSPTLSLHATQAGMILGTAAYMSPEQASSKPVDKRSDLWAFGVVLLEMLTGRRVFDGETVSHVLASVLKDAPDWSTLPTNTPAPIRKLLRRCLEKDRKHRLDSAADARLEIQDAQNPASDAGVLRPSTVVMRAPVWRRAVVPVAALILGGALVAGVISVAALPTPPRVTRLTIAPPAAAPLSVDGVTRDLAIAFDGSRVVYVGASGTQLFVRALDALDPVAIFKGGPRTPAISPDGQWVAFVDGNTTLKKVAITGGPAVTVARLDGGGPRGIAWINADTLVVATNASATGLQRVAVADGTITVLTRPDRAQGDVDHLWPEALPGGRAVLFTISRAGGLDAARVAVLDLQTGSSKVLIRGGSDAHYVPTGHLVYGAAGTLRAVSFDVTRLEVRGTPVPLGTEVLTTGIGAVDAVTAGNGTLAYVSGGTAGGLQRVLVWVDRQGRETPIPAPARVYIYPRVSPDGTRVAVWANDQDNDIWVWDFGRAILSRVTFDPGLDLWPVWTPDGRRLLFGSERAGARNLYWQAADGTGVVERLTDSPNPQYSVAVSPDGARLLFTETIEKTGEDVMQVALDGTRRVTPLVQTPFTERNGSVSPDGRWLAYEANDSGQFEIYVRPFPDVNSGHWQVSTGGGTRPLWAHSGQELFYLSPTGGLLRVGIERRPSWAATPPSMLVKEGYVTVSAGNPGLTYDVSPDDQRFLMIKPGTGSDRAIVTPSIVVVQNWQEELKRLVPTK